MYYNKNMNANMIINSPLAIGGKVAANRVVFQPMEGCDGTVSGGIGELTRRRYMRFAESGAGIIWFEAVAVSGECRANPRQLYLTEDNKDEFSRLIADVKKRAVESTGTEPLIIVQSTNSGRWSKPDGYPAPIIAYHNKLWEKGKEDLNYTVASDEYLDGIVQKYRRSARLAREVGFDGIDVKCCHGYLFDELLSAYDRTGKYGGSFENRTRLYFDCVDAVKREVGKDMTVTTRLNACDCFDYPYGYGVNEKNEIDLTETKKIISRLAEKGIELINLTLGNPYLIPHINRPSINAPEDGAAGVERIRKITTELQRGFKNIKFVMSGLTYMGSDSVEYAERMLREGAASFVGFGRMTFAYPRFYYDYINNGSLTASKCCLKCGKCTELMRNGSVTGCPVRDCEVYLPLYRKYVLKKEK